MFINDSYHTSGPISRIPGNLGSAVNFLRLQFETGGVTLKIGLGDTEFRRSEIF